MLKHLLNASRLASVQVDSLQTPFLFLSTVGKQMGRGCGASCACKVPDAAQRAIKDRAASTSRAWLLLCMQMETGIIKSAAEIAVSNPHTANRYFLLCSSEEISINMPKAQDCSRDLPVPRPCFYLHPCDLHEPRLLHQPVFFPGWQKGGLKDCDVYRLLYSYCKSPLQKPLSSCSSTVTAV